MTWTKLPDDFAERCADLDDHSFRIHVEAIAWVQRHSSDRFLTLDDVVSFTHCELNSDVVSWCVGELVDAQLWRIEQHPPGFTIVAAASD